MLSKSRRLIMSRTRSRARLPRLLPSQPSRPTFPPLPVAVLLLVLLLVRVEGEVDARSSMPPQWSAAYDGWVDEPANASQAPELESEAPFAGFEGSQKFPMKMTSRPATARDRVVCGAGCRGPGTTAPTARPGCARTSAGRPRRPARPR